MFTVFTKFNIFVFIGKSSDIARSFPNKRLRFKRNVGKDIPVSFETNVQHSRKHIFRIGVLVFRNRCNVTEIVNGASNAWVFLNLYVSGNIGNMKRKREHCFLFGKVNCNAARLTLTKEMFFLQPLQRTKGMLMLSVLPGLFGLSFIESMIALSLKQHRTINYSPKYSLDFYIHLLRV